jgi:Bax protein
VLCNGLPQEYYNIKNSKKMKKYFFNFMNKLALQENKAILSDREFIIKYFNGINNITKNDVKRFNTIQKRYKLTQDSSLDLFLYRINVIPNSLVMAQAAVESGWGKSRFVTEANNIFGHWTWSGDGIIPNDREEGKTHKIKLFKSLQSSVKAYMLNLNIGWAYKEFRELRSKIDIQNSPTTGLVLSQKLTKYSQKKEKYTKLLSKIIVNNKLMKYDIW